MKTPSEIKRVSYVIVSTDRGLCGGYNSNIVRQSVALLGQWKSEQVPAHVSVSGKRGISALKFRGADIAERVRQLYQAGATPVPAGAAPLRIISCHLGGSSSVTGIRDGIALGTSMGLSPQSGLPQNNRVGDLDSAAVPFVMKTLGLSLAEAERQMTKESGLLGLSGVGNDLRDVRAAAQQGNARAQLALDVFVQSARHWIGAFLLELNGADALVFTAGIGENNPDLRAAICANLGELGIALDPVRNEALRGAEGEISAAGSRAKILVIPANEELVVARETVRCLQAGR